MRAKNDLEGQTFGRLLVIGDAHRDGYVRCRCSCGNIVEVRKSSLTKTKNPTRSCGCLRSEVVREIGKKTIRKNSMERIQTNMKYNTNFQVIEKKTPPKNNKSGKTGVWFNPARGVYEAYISIHGKKIYLGRYTSLQHAVDARTKAETEFFDPLIKEKNEQRGE